jgi:hypothetical protein
MLLCFRANTILWLVLYMLVPVPDFSSIRPQESEGRSFLQGAVVRCFKQKPSPVQIPG